MNEEWAAVRDRVSARVTPDPEERAALEAALETALERAGDAIAALPVEATVEQVGSTARDTWLAGDRDLDVFVCFPPDLDRSDLEIYGLEVGHAVLPDGREAYAEHPYVTGEIDGFAVDLVPCYAVERATDIQSAVDRTPFHTSYVADRLDEDGAAAVRLAKAFASGIGVYGSDLRTRGFSGFLLELLVLEYGGFRELLEAAAAWGRPVHLDPEDHGTAQFEDPLVVIDPTDPERNVAAVCSATNVARFQHFARALLAEPRDSLFEAPRRQPLQADAVRAAFADRGTSPVALRFDAPDLVEDQLWPQLERSTEGVAGELDRRGFDILRSAIFVTQSGAEALLLFELAVAERPRIDRHEGPPVHVEAHGKRFFDSYEGNNKVYGPFIEGGRYVVERPREFETAAEFLESDALLEVAHGATIESVLGDGYDVVGQESLPELVDRFGVDFTRYLSPDPRGN